MRACEVLQPSVRRDGPAQSGAAEHQHSPDGDKPLQVRLLRHQGRGRARHVQHRVPV